MKTEDSGRTKPKTKGKGETRERVTDLILFISQLRVSGTQTQRTYRLSLTQVQRGAGREGETHSAETRVIPPARGSLGLDTEEGISFHTLLG